MEPKILRAYINECKRFGWEPSFQGANAYNWLVKKGFRGKWIA